jgi:hypothetical protein
VMETVVLMLLRFVMVLVVLVVVVVVVVVVVIICSFVSYVHNTYPSTLFQYLKALLTNLILSCHGHSTSPPSSTTFRLTLINLHGIYT